MTLLLTFSQSFFEQNVSVQLQLLRFSAIFAILKYNQKCGMFSKKMRECGKYVKMRDFPHDCGTVDTYVMEYVDRCVTNSLQIYFQNCHIIMTYTIWKRRMLN